MIMKYIGLNNYSMDLLKKFHIKKLDGESHFRYTNPFNSSNNFDLQVFIDESNGKKIYEKVEASEWFGCSSIFTFLMYEDGTIIEESKWIKESNGFYKLDYNGINYVFLNIKPFTWEPNTGMKIKK